MSSRQTLLNYFYMDALVGYNSVSVRTLNSQSREPGFEYSCCRFETWVTSFTQPYK